VLEVSIIERVEGPGPALEAARAWARAWPDQTRGRNELARRLSKAGRHEEVLAVEYWESDLADEFGRNLLSYRMAALWGLGRKDEARKLAADHPFLQKALSAYDPETAAPR